MNDISPEMAALAELFGRALAGDQKAIDILMSALWEKR